MAVPPLMYLLSRPPIASSRTASPNLSVTAVRVVASAVVVVAVAGMAVAVSARPAIARAVVVRRLKGLRMVWPPRGTVPAQVAPAFGPMRDFLPDRSGTYPYHIVERSGQGLTFTLVSPVGD